MDFSRIKNLIVIISGTLIFFIGILLGAFANLPGMYSYYSTTKYAAFLVAVCLSLVVVAFGFPSIKIKKDNIPFIRSGGIALLLLIISVIFSASLSNSLVGQYSLWEYNLLSYLGYAIVLFGLITFFAVLEETKLEKQIFSVLMLLVIILTVGYGFGEYYYWKPQTGYVSDSILRISLGFRNPLFAAFFIGMLWTYSFTNIISKWLWLPTVKHHKKEDEKKKPLEIGSFTLNVGLFALLTHVFILTFTRSAWLMAGASIFGLFIFLFMVLRKEQMRSIVQTGGTILIILAVIGINIVVLRQPLSQRTENTFSDASETLATISRSVGGSKENAEGFFLKADEYSSSEIRIMEWQWSLRAFIAEPKIALIGSGPDALFFVLPKYRDSIFNNIPTDSFTRPTYIRNMFLTLLLMHGILFFILVSVLGALVSWKVLMKFNNFDAEKKQHLLPVIFLVVAFLFQGVFYYPTFPILLLLVFAIAYLIISMNLLSVSVTQTKPATSIISVVLIVLFAAWAGLNIYAERRLDEISMYWIPTPEVVQGSYDIPVNSNIFKRIFLYYFPEEQRSLRFIDDLKTSNDLDDLRTVAAAFYADGRKNDDTSKVNESVRILKRMIELDPTTPTHYDELGLRYLYLQQFEESQKHFEKAMSLKNDYWYSYLHMGELLKQTCKPKEAIEWYKMAKQYVPQAQDEILKAETEIANPPEYCKK